MTNVPLIYLSVLVSILWLFIAPTFAVWIRGIFSVRKVLFMKKRYIDGSLYICGFASYWLLVDRPLSLLESYLFVSGYADKQSFFIFQCVMKLSYPFCGQGVVYALLYRFWMIHFDFIYSESLDNQQWKMQINPQGSSNKEQWIIDHCKDYGHSRWIFKRLAFIYVIVASFTASLRELAMFGVIEWSTANPIDSALYLIPLISTFVLWFKMPAFLDSFMVKDELKWMIVVSFVGLIMNITSLILLFMVISDLNVFWQEIVYFIPVLFLCIAWVFVQTQYILTRVRQNAAYFRDIFVTQYKHSADLSQSALSSPIYRKTGSSSVMSRPTKHKLCDILQDKRTFNLFVHHISTELSTECIFSFIEFTQFQMLLHSDELFVQKLTQHTKNKEHEHKTEDGTSTAYDHTLCRFVPLKSKKNHKDSYDKITLLDEETIPLSHIVYIQEYDNVDCNLDRYKCVIIALAQKYIYDSGDFCININYNTRSDIMEWIRSNCYDKGKAFNAQQYCEMYHLFEKCRREMYKLMQHILSRFVRTAPFLALSKQSK